MKEAYYNQWWIYKPLFFVFLWSPYFGKRDEKLMRIG